jgi:glycosyltransferase involved in cell wall biosynthesis
VTQTNPLVSVVVPTHNSTRTIEACLESIRSQVYQPIELVVVDNSSGDDTRQIAARFADIVEVYGPERSAQRNHGALLSHGQFLLFVDSDMRLTSSVVIQCVEAAKAGAPAVIIPEVSIGEGFWAQARSLERSCYLGDDAIEAARFFRRPEFERSGGYDENLVAMEDWDLSVRIARGQHLPRTNADIEHDEGRLKLGTVLAKKRYYGGAATAYWRKHGRVTLGQANLVFRPAFMRNWRRLLRHPILTAGLLALKTMEASAALLGVAQSAAGKRHAPEFDRTRP